MSRRELYSLAAFSRICDKIGVSLDMMVEIYEYFIWQPTEYSLYFKKKGFTDLIKFDYLEYMDVYNNNFYYRIYDLILGSLETYGVIDEYTSINQIVLNGKSIELNINEKINILMSKQHYNDITWLAEELFNGVEFKVPFSFRIVYN